MRHIVYKMFSLGGFENEEKWLNEMSAKGMQLVKIGFWRYEFEQGTPNEYVYRLEFLDRLPLNAESVEYLKFMEETGVEHIASYMRWVYFRKKAIDGPFELFSEISSKIKHYKRINHLLNVLMIIELAFAISYFWQAWNEYTEYGDWFRPHIFLGGFLTVLTAIMFFIGHPIRKALKALKKEHRIRE